jgi:hypothetical protein
VVEGRGARVTTGFWSRSWGPPLVLVAITVTATMVVDEFCARSSLASGTLAESRSRAYHVQAGRSAERFPGGPIDLTHPAHGGEGGDHPNCCQQLGKANASISLAPFARRRRRSRRLGRVFSDAGYCPSPAALGRTWVGRQRTSNRPKCFPSLYRTRMCLTVWGSSGGDCNGVWFRTTTGT